MKSTATIHTDEWLGYKHINKDYNRYIVNHSQKEYVVGNIHTNTIEGFWSFIEKRYTGNIPFYQ